MRPVVADTRFIYPVNSNCRDQRAVCYAPRATRRPSALRRRPFHFANPRARHERIFTKAASAAGLRLRLGGGVALRLRFALRFSPLHFPRSPTEATD